MRAALADVGIVPAVLRERVEPARGRDATSERRTCSQQRFVRARAFLCNFICFIYCPHV